MFRKVGQLISKRTLFIQTLTTPNTNALKFVPSGVPILPSNNTPTVEINSIKEAVHKSELALKLLSLNDKAINSILFGYDFITIVKNDNSIKGSQDWSILKPQIFALLTEHFTMGQDAISTEFFNKLKLNDDKNIIDNDDNDLSPEEEVVELIKELLTTRIQPAIREDGGDIQFNKFDHNTGIVYLRLIGACKSCSSSEVTLKSGIEDMLKYYIDEVKEVINEEQPIANNDNDSDNDNKINSQIVKDKQMIDDELPPAL